MPLRAANPLPLGVSRRGLSLQVYAAAGTGPDYATTWGAVRGPAVVETVSIVHYAPAQVPPGMVVPVVFPGAIGFRQGAGFRGMLGAGLRVLQTYGGQTEGIVDVLQEAQPLVYHVHLRVPWPVFAPGLLLLDWGILTGGGVAVTYSIRFL